MTRLLEEQETTYRWDRAERVLWGWTANRSEAQRWRALGYPVTEERSGWRTAVPVEALALLPLKDGVVQVSRYLAPPVLIAPAVGDGPREARNFEQMRGAQVRAPRTAHGEGSGMGGVL